MSAAGDLYWVDLDGIGNEQRGRRPFLVLSQSTPRLVTGVPLTTSVLGWLQHVPIEWPDGTPTFAMCEQVTTI